MCGEIVRNTVGLRPLLEVALARYAVVGEHAAGHPAERVENQPDDWTRWVAQAARGGRLDLKHRYSRGIQKVTYRYLDATRRPLEACSGP